MDFSSYGDASLESRRVLDALNALMLHGTMSADMQSRILTAMQAVPAGSTQALTQAQTAIYLVASSSQYQVQH